VQRFLLGVDLRLDGAVVLAPLLTPAFWEKGVGQALSWRDRVLRYHMCRDTLRGTFAGRGVQRLGCRFPHAAVPCAVEASVGGKTVPVSSEGDLWFITIAPPADGGERAFTVWRKYRAAK